MQLEKFITANISEFYIYISYIYHMSDISDTYIIKRLNFVQTTGKQNRLSIVATSSIVNFKLVRKLTELLYTCNQKSDRNFLVDDVSAYRATRTQNRAICLCERVPRPNYGSCIHGQRIGAVGIDPNATLFIRDQLHEHGPTRTVEHLAGLCIDFRQKREKIAIASIPRSYLFTRRHIGDRIFFFLHPICSFIFLSPSTFCCSTILFPLTLSSISFPVHSTSFCISSLIVRVDLILRISNVDSFHL